LAAFGTETRNKKQETRNKKQKTKNKKQGTEGINSSFVIRVHF